MEPKSSKPDKKPIGSPTAGMPEQSGPPKWLDKLLNKVVAPHLREEVLGDIYERYYRRAERLGVHKARKSYWWEVLAYVRPAFIKRNRTANQSTSYYPRFGEHPQPLLNLYMIRSYLTIAWRNLQNEKSYTVINITGLAIGVASSLLIALYVQDELAYDRHYPRAADTYRITGEYRSEDDQTNAVAKTPFRLATLLTQGLPSVEKATRLRAVSAAVTYQQHQFQEERFFLVDSSYFDVFPTPLRAGDPSRALQNPLTIVISEAMAHKYFGQQEVIGKVMQILGMNFQVTGVMANPTQRSHFQADFLASMAHPTALFGEAPLQNWGETGFYTYLQLKPGTAPTVETALPALLKIHVPDRAKSWTLRLQPLTRIHLHSDLKGEIRANGNATAVYILTAVAFFILLLACVNFVNLATARSARRAKEVGVRKVAGAHRWQLIGQFYGETGLLVLIALAFALLLAGLAMPLFNNLSGKTLSLNVMDNWLISVGLVMLTGFITLAAGSFPAFVLSDFRPLQVMKGVTSPRSRGISLRNGLVVFQFVISILFVIATMVVSTQLDYLLHKDYGFNRNSLIFTWMPPGNRYETVRDQLVQLPGVMGVTASSKEIPQVNSSNFPVKAEGIPEKSELGMQIVSVDYDYLRTIGAKVIEGRDFSRQFATDSTGGYILNESAVRMLGWTKAVGKRFETVAPTAQGGMNPKPGRVIGVVADFHVEPLHKRIEPVAYYVTPTWFSRLLIRIAPNRLAQTLATLEQQWKILAPGTPFSAKFVDETFQTLYDSEIKLSRLIQYFAGLLVLIAGLGLFALSAYTAEQRAKEIGVRKVLGASVANIVALLGAGFIKLVLIAFLIAAPLAWWTMHRWLENFAYQVTIGWGTFTVAGLLAMGIALLTVSFQSLKAALVNPVKSLKSE